MHMQAHVLSVTPRPNYLQESANLFTHVLQFYIKIDVTMINIQLRNVFEKKLWTLYMTTL